MDRGSGPVAAPAAGARKGAGFASAPLDRRNGIVHTVYMTATTFPARSNRKARVLFTETTTGQTHADTIHGNGFGAWTKCVARMTAALLEPGQLRLVSTFDDTDGSTLLRFGRFGEAGAVR